MDEANALGPGERMRVIEDLVALLLHREFGDAELRYMIADTLKIADERISATPLPNVWPARMLRHRASLLQEALDLSAEPPPD